LSKDFPSQFGRSDQYRNPNGTLPLPSAQDIPRPQWYSGNLNWKWKLNRIIEENDDNALVPGFEYIYQWTSPAFDLRPDLRSGQAGPKAGVPIWSSAARLYLQVSSSAQGGGVQPSLVLQNYTAQARDYVANTYNFSDTKGRPSEGINAGWGLQSTSLTDVASKFNPAPNATSVLAGFAPPGTTLGFGDGYPVRYWRLEITFTILVPSGLPLPVNPLPAPAVVMQASMY
jgi:hypothetical protein